MTPKLFTIQCETHRGLLTRFIQLFEKAAFTIIGLSKCKTEVNNIDIIMMEVELPSEIIDRYVRKLSTFIGVINVVVSFGDVLHQGYFRVSTTALDGQPCRSLTKFGASIINISPDVALIRKAGNKKDLQSFYNHLEGPDLLGACYQIIPVNENGLVGFKGYLNFDGTNLL